MLDGFPIMGRISGRSRERVRLRVGFTMVVELGTHDAEGKWGVLLYGRAYEITRVSFVRLIRNKEHKGKGVLSLTSQ